MHTENLPLEETHCFSPFFIDYINQKEELAPFYTQFPTIKSFEETIKNRTFEASSRQVLVQTLTSQYSTLKPSDAVLNNIQALADSKTFTVTTGHQLNIFTGPLYFIYKIVTVINACKRLKQAYPAYHFVPVYWMASEDHDFAEISYFHFKGKKYQWQTDQTGAVGRFDPSQLATIAKKLPQGAEFFEEAYSQESLAKSGRAYVNHLFGHEGLVVVDADDQDLKKLFIPVIEDDLFAHSSEKLVAKTSDSLESLGYKTQVHAREINFFYLDKNIRERLEKTDTGFHVLNTDISFSEEEIRQLIEASPERFSPNVILRPLYQETILPNLAYVGGPSEVVYWLQLKDVFDHFQTPFPLLMPRNFALVIEKHLSEKWGKTGLESADLFLSADQSFSKWVSKNTHHELSYADELAQLEQITEQLKTKAEEIDPTLLQHLDALHATHTKKIQLAEKKLLRAEKRKYEDKKTQILSLKGALFPSGSLQERRENFLNFYLKDPEFIQKLLHTFDPFEYQMLLLFA